MNPRQREVCLWAKAHMENKDFCIIDTETTGLDQSAEVLSIAVVNAWGRVALSSLCKPRNPIDEGGKAFAVNGISNDMVDHAPQFEDVWAMVLKHIPLGNVIAYNAEFDFRLITQNLSARACFPFFNFWECAMLQYARYRGDPGEFGDWRWHRLEIACAQMGLPGQYFHEAATDALATWALMNALAAKIEVE